MTAIMEIIGENVLGKNGRKVDVVTLCKDKNAIGLYFSAHWCPPCRAFTPVLAETYNRMSSKFEVIFVSNDRDESSFQQYFRQMPWHAIPYHGETRDLLSEMYRVRGIPYLVILGPDGRKISDKGREVIMEGKLERLIAS